jgi:CheY-like chemotaxis protein
LANIVLSGLETPEQADLSRVLSEQGHHVTIGWEGIRGSAEVVFCNADAPEHPALVREIRKLCPDLPVVAVTSNAEVAKWLDALDAGAADYCSAPFETVQICRLLTGVLGQQPKPR